MDDQTASLINSHSCMGLGINIMTKPETKDETVIEHDEQLPEIVDESAENNLSQIKSGPIVLVPAQSQADRLLEMAISNGTDMAQLEKLLDLKDRYDKEEARKAFTAALAAFKSEDILIVKDRYVGFDTSQGRTEYTHASLGNIIKIAVPLLSKHGLSHRWVLDQSSDGVKVTCILTHEAGHSEQTSLVAMPDGSGKKNAIQQVSSTITYLERYTFLAIAGLAVEEQDDDGVAAGAPVAALVLITETQANTIHAKITDNDLNMDIFMKWLRNVAALKVAGVNEIDDIPVDYYDKVMKKLDDTIKVNKNG